MRGIYLSFSAILSATIVGLAILLPAPVPPTVALLPNPISHPILLPYILLCYLPLSLPFSLSPDLFTPPPSPSYPAITPFNTYLGGATKFSRTTLPFRCLLIESLSPSNGSVRIIPKHRGADRLIEGEIRRDKGMERDAKKGSRRGKGERRRQPRRPPHKVPGQQFR